MRRARLTGALVEAHEQGAVVLTEEQCDRLHEAHVDALVWCLRIEDRMCTVVETLADAGVDDVRILKGPAIAHLDEDDPSRRTFGDLDLLVRGRDLDRVIAVLDVMGATRPYAERRPGFDRRFAKSVTLTFPDGVEVDLHRTLCDGVHAVRLPVDRLWERPDRFAVGGVGLATLGPTARVLHAAYHAVLGSSTPAPMSRRDLLGYLARTDATVDDIGREAERWGGTAVLTEAVRSVLDLPGVDLPGWSEWVARTTVPAAERRIVAAQRRDGSSYGPSRLRAVAEMTSWRDRVAYATAVLMPSREHLASRGLTRTSLVARARPRR